MKLHELKTLLKNQSGKLFQLQLPGGDAVPVSFHVTEVGRVQKTFIDCGGTLREQVTCQLQVWVGEDVEHRLEAGKAAAILQKAATFLPDDTVPVEIEYEDEVISQYTITGHEMRDDLVVLKLAHKHTECLAPELCVMPARDTRWKPASLVAKDKPASCCGPAGCC